MKLRLNWLCLQDPDVSVRGDDLQLPGEVRREAAELPANLVHIQRRHQQLLPGNIWSRAWNETSRSLKFYTIMEKAPSRAFSWLKATALETDILPCIVSEAEAFIWSYV